VQEPNLVAVVNAAPGYCLTSRAPATQGGPPPAPHVYTLKSRIQLGVHPNTVRVDAGNTVLAEQWVMAFSIQGNTYYVLALEDIYAHGTPELVGAIERVSVGEETSVGVPGLGVAKPLTPHKPGATQAADHAKVQAAHAARAQAKAAAAVPSKPAAPAPKQTPSASRKDDPRNVEGT
jgi:hypothetical protein